MIYFKSGFNDLIADVNSCQCE